MTRKLKPIPEPEECVVCIARGNRGELLETHCLFVVYACETDGPGKVVKDLCFRHRREYQETVGKMKVTP